MLLSQIFALTEEVTGALAVGYHRTRNLQNVKAIGESGFVAGTGSFYGKGVYLTYDFESQQNERMKKLYGQYVIRSKVNLSGFLIFDEEPARRAYGKEWSLEDQWRRHGLDPGHLVFIRNRASEYTSSMAKAFSSLGDRSKGTVQGLVFTGAQDGRVVVAYDPARVIPFGQARVIDLEKTLTNVRWNKIDASGLVKATPTAQPTSPMTAAAHYFRKQGWALKTPLHNSTNQVILIKDVEQGALVMQIQRRQGFNSVDVVLTRRDAHKLSREFYILQKIGLNVLISNYDDVKSYRTIESEIATALRTMKRTPEIQIDFAKTLMNHLAPNLPITVEHDEGPDYARDHVLIKTSAITIDLQNMYGDFRRMRDGISGLLILNTRFPKRSDIEPVELWFRTSAIAANAIELAYETILQAVDTEKKILKYVLLPDGLSEKFAQDITSRVKPNVALSDSDADQ